MTSNRPVREQRFKERHLLPGFYHDTFGEQDRHLAVGKARDFILRRFAEPCSRPGLRHADRQGPTHDEAIALARPLPRLSPRGLYWALTRRNMRLGGLLSAGIALGHQTGFDSGSTLDYVYRNTPTGHGRYVLEALESYPHRPESILLRDFSDINVRDGNALIREKGLQGIATFVKGDAFDPDSLAAVSPKPGIGIVSGLYELFPDNDAACHSLAGLAAAIEPGGYLLYTCQPWHPQLELIARALARRRQP